MADPEHIEILKQGVEVWNKWRVENPTIKPNLRKANLETRNLRGIDFRNTDLRRAKLRDADLAMQFNSHGVELRANLDGANLRDAELLRATLMGVSLRDADLSYTDLISTSFRSADLQNTNLSSANVYYTDFAHANLDNIDISNAELWGASFGDNDLSTIKGLNTILHRGPSYLSVDTVYRSLHNLPNVFLRGCGIPDEFITFFPSLVASKQAIQFYSCFISYSSKDQEFAERLHADLQSKGVRVWFAPHDMKIGARLRPTIDESIRVYDKLLLVLSANSVGSRWVEQEVETALTKEEAGREVLFPVRLDDAVMGIQAGWPALVKRTRHVGDFTRWKEHDSYRKAFDRLLRDLKAGA